MKILSLIATIILSTALATAATAAAGAEHDNHIPWDKIGWQAANLGILLLIIFFGIRKSIIESFAKRQTDFLEQSEKTKSLLKQAEAELAEIKQKLSILETGEAKSIENAKHEANLIKAHMIKDAEVQAEKLKQDAELSIRNELTKAKAEINQVILAEAVNSAKDKLSSGSTNKTIESQFLSQVEKAHTTKAEL